MRIALISCAKSKREDLHKAKDLYVSPLFRFAWQYTSNRFDGVFILSAKHGLLEPDKKIRKYDSTLNTMPIDDRRQWSAEVAKQIRQKIANGAEIHFFCGGKYREFLRELLSDYRCFVPLLGLSIGKQLQWYKENM